METLRARYTARVLRSGDWWAIDVAEIRGVHSQARRLDRVEYMARDAIALWLEIPGDSFDLDIRVELPRKVRGVVDAVGAVRERSAVAQREESETLRAAVDAMLSSGLTLRDTGRLLGVSHQRIAQLATVRRRAGSGGGGPTALNVAAPGG